MDDFSKQQRLDAFCRDLALILRRITGREGDVDPSRLPKAGPRISHSHMPPSGKKGASDEHSNEL